MAIGIDEIDDYDVNDFVQENEPQQDQEPLQEEKDDILVEYLKTRGIEDPNRILFEDEDSQTVERSWDSLSKEEKLNILNTPLDVEPYQEKNNEELSEEEINFINELRNKGVTPQQYIESLQAPVEPSYKVDDLSDDEIYLLDLESRIGELTEEQAVEALNNAKSNEELYKKQVEGIRKEYKEREDYEIQQEQAAQELENQQMFAQYQQAISRGIDELTSVGNLDINLEDDDKETLAEFILSTDPNGENYLEKALQDPKTLVKAAWFILNGDEAINNIEEYFTDQIKKVSDAQYKKGFEDAKNGKQPTRKVVISNQKRQQNSPQPNTKVYQSLEDLDD